jgi:hypothetical protein
MRARCIQPALLALITLAAMASAAHGQDVKRPAHLSPSRRSTDVPRALPLKFQGPPTTGAITPLDLMTRLYKFADDSMMGRLAGTPWNDKGTDYIASEVKRLGLTPAGDDGYFQHPLVSKAFADSSWIGVGGKRFTLWKDFAPRYQGDTIAVLSNAPVVFGGTWGDSASYLPKDQATGKVVVVRLAKKPDGSVDYQLVNRAQLTARFSTAAAVAVTQLDYVPPGYVEQNYAAPSVGVKTDAESAAPHVPSYFYVTSAVADEMLGAPVASAQTGATGRAVDGRLHQVSGVAPGRNVLAILPGADPRLKGEFVVIGAHDDHIGFNHTPADHDSIKAVMMHAAPQGADSPDPKPTPEQWAKIRVTMDSLRKLHPSRPDSIYNGADDDGTGSMALLEIAERFATAPVRPKRSVIFAWHVGEEEGMLGSGFFTDHPTVSRDSIVAQLNIDMIGRGKSSDATGEDKEGKLLHGGAGYLQLIGSRRLSTELGDMVEKVNAREKLGLKFDYALDANGHPQNIYCRSDHWSYARWGIPIVFFTTGGHADYHQVTDEPQYIDYDHAAAVTRLIHATAVNVANLDHRVVVDKPKPDPHGDCKQ